MYFYGHEKSRQWNNCVLTLFSLKHSYRDIMQLLVKPLCIAIYNRKRYFGSRVWLQIYNACSYDPNTLTLEFFHRFGLEPHEISDNGANSIYIHSVRNLYGYIRIVQQF